MMKALIRSAAFLCAIAMMPVFSVSAAENSGGESEIRPDFVSKDVRTRAKLHTQLGSLYFQNGNLIVALEELTIATSIDPDYAQAYSTRGLVLYNIKEWPSAEKDFQKALSLDDKDPGISNNYGWFLCHTGKAKESIEYFQRAIGNSLYQTLEIAYLNMGSCYADFGNLDAAEENVRKSMRFQPSNPAGLFQLARINYLRGNYDAAKAHLSKLVVAADPGANVLWLYLRVERHLGDEESADTMAAQLRRKYPDSSEYQEFLKGNFE